VSLNLLHNSNTMYYKSMPVVETSLTLSLLFRYQYVRSSKSEIIDSASPDIRLDFLHGRRCSPLSHVHVLLSDFYCKIFQFGKPIYADYFLEALYGLA